MWTIVKPNSNDANKPQTPEQDWRNDVKESAPYTPSPTVDHGSAGYNPSRVQQMTRNVLNSDVEVTGSLRFSDDLLIDGRVDGDISSEGVLSVGENAVIRAEINTKSVIIHGKVIGNVTVTDRVELKSTAELVGDIQAATLAIEAGAIFIGRSTVGVPSVGSARPAAAETEATAPKPVAEASAPAQQSELAIDAE